MFKSQTAAPTRFSRTALTAIMTSGLMLTMLPATNAAAITVDKKYTVTFTMAEINTEFGTQTVYAKLTERATEACKGDVKTLDYTGESVQSCVSDLVDQFVKSANVEALTAYHLNMSDAET